MKRSGFVREVHLAFKRFVILLPRHAAMHEKSDDTKLSY